MAEENNEKIDSLDPRIMRASLDHSDIDPLESLDQFQTFEVFHQAKRGAQHQHVGIVHAPNPEMALLYAKEQYARRGVTANLWVVPSKYVFATSYFDDDMFDTTPEKIHRDPATYKVMDKIKEYKERQEA
ncbi:1,2-phenylacetyl-CoA epoxidase subunit B [bacterium]|nr:1,2-phenylacetyl-CoA epoxidase subunit B [bacterium]